jgi:hypothetical protein
LTTLDLLARPVDNALELAVASLVASNNFTPAIGSQPPNRWRTPPRAG